MSTIAWDGLSLVSDRQMTHEGIAETASKIRVSVTEDAIDIIGMIGRISSGLALIDWYIYNRKKDEYPKWQDHEENFANMVVVHLTKSNYCVLEYDTVPYPITRVEKFCAWGSGKAFALGALEMGASAAQAVQVASKFDVYTGRGETIVNIMEIIGKWKPEWMKEKFYSQMTTGLTYPRHTEVDPLIVTL